jgi:hypothetical protein
MGTHYTIFRDYTNASNLLDRGILMRKLKTVAECSHAEKCRIKNILMVKYFRICDNLCASNERRQTNGVLHGNLLSHLLVNIAINNVIKAIQDDNRTRINAYLDDVVMVSASIQQLHELLNNLVQWGEGNSLEVNVGRREWSSGRVKK